MIFWLAFLGLRLKIKKDPIRDLTALEQLKYLDPAGIILLLGAVSCLFLALQWGGSRFSWSSIRIIGLLIGFGTLFITFGVLQWRLAEKATIPLRILRQRTVLFGALTLFFISMSSNIVCVLSFGRPAELFTTDMFSRSYISFLFTSKLSEAHLHNGAALIFSRLQSLRLLQLFSRARLLLKLGVMYISHYSYVLRRC